MVGLRSEVNLSNRSESAVESRQRKYASHCCTRAISELAFPIQIQKCLLTIEPTMLDDIASLAVPQLAKKESIVNFIHHNSAAKMQRSWLILSLLGYLITISAALPTLQTVNTSLDSFENDILATKSSNNTLRIDSNDFPAFNASNNRIDIRCFPSHSPLEMVVMDDYYGAVDQILVQEDAMTPREWVLGPTHTQHIEWREGSCRIVLMAGTTIRTRPFPVILVAHVAALVAKGCVTEAYGFRGGIATLNDLGNAVVWLGAYQDGSEGPAAQT